MNKLSQKLSIKISVVIILVFCISFFINNYFIDKYYLHQKKIYLGELSKKIEGIDLESIYKLEEKYEVTVVCAPLDYDINALNSSIKEQFNRKKITLNKFWITQEKIDKLKRGNSVNQIYNQGKLKSSYLVRFIKKENAIVVIGMAIPHSGETIAIVNQFNLYLTILSILFIIVLVWFTSKRIISPLEGLKDLARDIAELNFKKVDIKTGDEIEDLSNSINIMSEKLSQAHNELKEKNQNLKKFITDISHEIKTPLALIKAYSVGLKDGLDDGTYIDIINQQVDDISDLIDNLIKLSKLEKSITNKMPFHLEKLFAKVCSKYDINVKNKAIFVALNKEKLENDLVVADEEKIEIVLNNLISNAIRYSADNKIGISLSNTEHYLLFSIKNEMERHEKDAINKIWEPFYVLEKSRDKKSSGTGLGLSIVKAILEDHGLKYGFNYFEAESEIEFYIYFTK